MNDLEFPWSERPDVGARGAHPFAPPAPPPPPQHVAKKRIGGLAGLRQAGRQQSDLQDLQQANELPVRVEH